MQKYTGTLWNALGSLMYGANSFAMLALVSRVGTVEEIGYFGISFTVAQFLYIVGTLGVSNYQMTDYQERYRFSDYAQSRVFACGLMAVGCIGAILGFQFGREKIVYVVELTVLMALNVVGELYQNLFFQKNRLDLSGSALFYRTLWSFLAFCMILFSTRDIIAAMGLQIAVNLGVTLYYMRRVAPRFLLDQPKETQSEHNTWRTLLRECLPLFGSLLLMNYIISASKFGIEMLMDDTAQGYYNMIFMPVQVINLCSQFIFKPLLNRYAQMLANREIKEFKGLLVRQILIITIFALSCLAMAYWLGTPVLGFLYQKDLSQFKIVLTVTVLGGGIFAVCQLFYYVLVIVRKQKIILSIYVMSSFLSVIITVELINKLGLFGAALSFVLIHIIILCLYVGALFLTLRRYKSA